MNTCDSKSCDQYGLQFALISSAPQGVANECRTRLWGVVLARVFVSFTRSLVHRRAYSLRCVRETYESGMYGKAHTIIQRLFILCLSIYFFPRVVALGLFVCWCCELSLAILTPPSYCMEVKIQWREISLICLKVGNLI